MLFFIILCKILVIPKKYMLEISHQKMLHKNLLMKENSPVM